MCRVIGLENRGTWDSETPVVYTGRERAEIRNEGRNGVEVPSECIFSYQVSHSRPKFWSRKVKDRCIGVCSIS